MSMIEHFRRLFAYDEWANREVLVSLRAASPPPVRAVALFAHIVSAERLWLERIRGQAQPFPVWPNFPFEQCASEAEKTSELWKGYLAQISEAGLAETVTYTNTAGQSWKSRLEDVIMHVVMHSAYHRGQIACVVRVSGETPAYTDFIHAVRQSLVE
jgi:uncharacterized damage-inducible protein DinB